MKLLTTLKVYYLLSIIYCLLCIASCQTSDLESMESIEVAGLPDEVSTNVTMVYSDSGRQKFIMVAPLIHKFVGDSAYTIFPKGVKGYFLNTKGDTLSRLRSNYAYKIEKSEKVFFKKDVVFTNYKKETLRTEEIYLQNDSVFSSMPLSISTPSIRINGVGLRAKKDFTWYKMKNITGNVDPKSESIGIMD